MQTTLDRATRTPRTLRTFTALQHTMRTHFARLSQPHTLEHTLRKINDIRSFGYRFGKDVDPGLHVPLGTA